MAPAKAAKKPRQRAVRRETQISRHPERVAIEKARVAGIPLDRIAERFGVKRDSIWRHMDGLPDAYKAALIIDVPRDELMKRAIEEDGNLLDHFKLIRNIAETQLAYAKACNDSRAVGMLTRASIAANKAIGELNGEIKRLAPGGVTIHNTVAIMESPQFRAFERGLIDIARNFPDAKPAIQALIRSSREAVDMPPMIEGEHAHAA